MRRWAIVALGLAALSCGGTRAAPAADRSHAGIVVRVDHDATVGDLLAALRTSLRARGHAGDCFLAWDVEVGEHVVVHVGNRSRSAALSCGSLQALTRVLEGRCPALRLFWVAPGPAMRTSAMASFFGPPGTAFAAAPVLAASTAGPAHRAVFDEAPEGARAVLGIRLEEPGGQAGAQKQDETPEDGANPLEDPEVLARMEELVARVQRCNPSGEGSLVVEWSVLADGTVTNPRALVSTVGDEVVRCALDAIAASSFPEHEGAAIDYCAPVLLAPELRPRPQSR